MRTLLDIPETSVTRRVIIMGGRDGNRGVTLICMIVQTALPAPHPLCCWVATASQHPSPATGHRLWACFPP